MTIPLQRKEMQEPVTVTQKLVTDYHQKHLNEMYENIWLGPPAEGMEEEYEEEPIEFSIEK